MDDLMSELNATAPCRTCGENRANFVQIGGVWQCPNAGVASAMNEPILMRWRDQPVKASRRERGEKLLHIKRGKT